MSFSEIGNAVGVEKIEKVEGSIRQQTWSPEDCRILEQAHQDVPAFCSKETSVWDDNGKLCVEDGKRVPECEYTINGYQYKTDAQSRITSVSGELHMKDREGRLPIRNSMQEIGGGDARKTDDRGHLVGDQFDGSNGLENLVPMAKDLNRGAYLNLEREFATAKKAGKDVSVDIKVKYDGPSNRPSRFDIRYNIDGETMRRVLKNGG